MTAALLTLDPATIGMLAAANMLTPDGRCKTLDAAADGCDLVVPFSAAACALHSYQPAFMHPLPLHNSEQGFAIPWMFCCDAQLGISGGQRQRPADAVHRQRDWRWPVIPLRQVTRWNTPLRQRSNCWYN